MIRVGTLALLMLVLLPVAGCVRVRGMFEGAKPLLESTMAASVTIIRDERGVAHVYGPTDVSVAFGSAYAQAEDDYRQIEEGTVRAIGRAANLHGDMEIANDLVRVAFDVERRSRAEYAAEPADRRAVWDGFAAGLNHFAAVSGVQRRLIGRWEPWMIFARFQLTPGITAASDSISTVHLELTHQNAADTVTSVAWAIPSARSATKAPLFLFSSYGPFEGAERPYEIHVQSDEGWSFRGAVLLGTPVPYAAFTAQNAWAITQQRDATVTTSANAVSIVERIDTLRVNTASGVQPRAYRFRRTSEGVVIGRDARANRPQGAAAEQEGKLLVTPWPRSGRMQQQFAMSRSRTLAEFQAAVAGETQPSTASAANGIETVYADGSGEVARFRDGIRVNTDAGWVMSGDVATSPAQDSSWTIDALAAAAFDARLPRADTAIDALVLEWEQVGGTNPSRAGKLDSALDTLRLWNRAVAPESRATTLFVLWRMQLARTDGAFPRFRALEDVVAVQPVLKPWGDVSRLERNGARETFPLLALPRSLRSMTRFDRLPAIGGSSVATGNAWILVVQPGSPETARSILVNGQSGDSASAHHFDQAPAYARGQLQPAWFSRESVLANARRTYRPGLLPDTVR